MAFFVKIGTGMIQVSSITELKLDFYGFPTSTYC